jgi:hypothetical protein
LEWRACLTPTRTATAGTTQIDSSELPASTQGCPILFPNDEISIRIAKAAQLPAAETLDEGDVHATLRAVERLSPF